MYLKLQTPVRKRQVKTITLTNNTSDTWKLKPTFENDFWSGVASSMKIPAGQTAIYEVFNKFNFLD